MSSLSQSQILVAVKNAVEENRLDLYLQPMVTLPQRKVRYYEAVTRLRDDKDQIITADDFVGVAEAAGLIGRIDHMVMLRCVQVLRRLMVRNKEVGVFCNVAAATLGNPATFAQCLDFLEANRALAPSFVLEFKQCDVSQSRARPRPSIWRRWRSAASVSRSTTSPTCGSSRATLPTAASASSRCRRPCCSTSSNSSTSDIHPSDLSDLLGRFGIDLIAERIEGERAVVDLLDYDVRFGQGFLFAPPRPLRPEGRICYRRGRPRQGAGDAMASGKTPAIAAPAMASDASTRRGRSAIAALARRIAGPG